MRNKKISKRQCPDLQIFTDENNPLTNLPYSIRCQEILNENQSLPILKLRNKIMKALENNDIIIIEGETGSRKSTQIP